MTKLLPLLALSLAVACSHDDHASQPKIDLTTSKGAALLALQTLKKSVDKLNYSAFGFKTLEETKDAKLEDLVLDEERFGDGATAGAPTLTRVPNAVTYPYQGLHGRIGEITVVKINNEWRPSMIGANREMQQINALLSTIRSAGAQPRAIVRVRSLSEVYIRFEEGGKSRLARPQDGAKLQQESLEDSLLKLRERIQALPPSEPP